MAARNDTGAEKIDTQETTSTQRIRCPRNDSNMMPKEDNVTEKMYAQANHTQHTKKKKYANMDACIFFFGWLHEE